MASDTVLYDVADGVATITLNRPDRLNAYTLGMGEAAYAALQRARGDAGVRAVLLTGAGRGFCAGVDLEHLKTQTASTEGPRLGEEPFVRKLPLELLSFPKPVIAAVNGAAIGVGVTMILPCDIRIAAADAKLGVTFTKLGILPGLGSTHLLPRLVGTARALELVLTAKVIRGSEAAEIGLVNRAVPVDDVVREARELATILAELDPATLAAAKRAVWFGAGASMEEAMANEQRESAALRRSRASS